MTPGRKIVADVAAQHGLSLDDMTGPVRRAALSRARWQAMAAMRDTLGYSYRRIGLALGGRDHSTVFHGIARWRAMEAGE